MLSIVIQAIELYNEVKNEFVVVKTQTLQLEHSLVSLSKWEAKWKKPFLSKNTQTLEETIDYVKCMTITQNVNPIVYEHLTNDNLNAIKDYISAPMTATTFSNDNQKTNREVITAEIIYWWMITMNIPFECQKWHLNRLLTLINVCSIKNAPPKKMNKKDIYRKNSALNAARKQALNTGG